MRSGVPPSSYPAQAVLSWAGGSVTPMSLSGATGPLNPRSSGVRSADGRRFAHPYGPRVTARVGDATVVDSDDVWMEHGASPLPRLWFPAEAVDRAALRGDAVAEAEDGDDEEAAALAGRVSVAFDAADRWFLEDEPVYAHIKDPFHRVDVTRSSRHVVVTVGDTVIAETRRPRLLFETGLPVRHYVPFSDVRTGLLEKSETVSECPYKGDGQHWHVVVDGERIEDAAWSLPAPLPEGVDAREHVCFYDGKVTVTVDGERLGA